MSCAITNSAQSPPAACSRWRNIRRLLDYEKALGLELAKDGRSNVPRNRKTATARFICPIPTVEALAHCALPHGAYLLAPDELVAWIASSTFLLRKGGADCAHFLSLAQRKVVCRTTRQVPRTIYGPQASTLCFARHISGILIALGNRAPRVGLAARFC